MFNIKPDVKKNLGRFLLFAIFGSLITFTTKGSVDFLFIVGIVLVLLFILTIRTILVCRISLELSTIKYRGIFTDKIILIDEIQSIEVNGAAGKGYVLSLIGKNGVRLLSFGIAIFKRDDVRKLITQIMNMRSGIVLSEQVKNIMDGKIYGRDSY